MGKGLSVISTETNTVWRIYARRPSDFAVLDLEIRHEHEARAKASELAANGYNVKVDRIVRDRIAEWKAQK